MESLFEDLSPKATNESQKNQYRPLAERVRPTSIDDVAGQEHLLGEGAPLRTFIQRGELPSMILWGPPGTGKTTLAHILTSAVGAHIERLSAVDSGVKELRDVLRKAEILLSKGSRTVVFIDEIHRFTTSQQDALLHAVERGHITLIGATTENPSFKVNNALLSRCQVYLLNLLNDVDLRHVIERAINTISTSRGVTIVVNDWTSLLRVASGDARKALNVLETITMSASAEPDNTLSITTEAIERAIQKPLARYDRVGDYHYDTISALIKSMRGGDANAALLYCAVMLDAGEDPLFIARRLVIFASEDVGIADVHALPLAVSAFEALERIGMPEGRIVIGHVVVYLSNAPKSRAAYNAINAALATVRAEATIVVPMHLRNYPPTKDDSGYSGFLPERLQDIDFFGQT
jgi:putative ATPase